MPVIVINRAMCVEEYGAECGKCVDACPSNAVMLNPLSIDASRCTACGACQRACPNEAIVVKPVSRIGTRRCEALGGDIPCIAYVGEELVNRLGKGVYEFCSDCYRGANVEAEARRLRELGVEVRLRPSGVTSRRRLFARVETMYVERRGVPEKRKYSNKLHCKSVDPAKCWFCGHCFSACPTGALIGEVDGDVGRIRFSAQACTGCTLCVQVCPSKAIDKSEKCGEELFAARLRRCQSCGRLFAGDSPICPVCRGLDEELRSLFA